MTVYQASQANWTDVQYFDSKERVKYLSLVSLTRPPPSIHNVMRCIRRHKELKGIFCIAKLS